MRFLRGPFDVLLSLWRKRGEYDVIHLHQHSWISLYVILVAKSLGKRVLTKLPNVGDLGIPGLQRKALGSLRTFVLLKSDAMVAMSQESVDELQTFGYPFFRILTVSNGISLLQRTRFHRAQSSALPMRIVFVGRLSPEKSLDTLLKAWKKVKDRATSRVQLELWGDGPQETELRRLCRELDISDSVLFSGYVSNVRQRLPEVDIFVLPSSFEGNSNAVLEAMEAGLPIVATAVGGTPMQVGTEGAPLLFPVGDSSALADRLVLLIENPNLRQVYGDAMALRAVNQFDILKVAETYSRAYETLIAQDRPDLSTCGQLPL